MPLAIVVIRLRVPILQEIHKHVVHRWSSEVIDVCRYGEDITVWVSLGAPESECFSHYWKGTPEGTCALSFNVVQPGVISNLKNVTAELLDIKFSLFPYNRNLCAFSTTHLTSLHSPSAGASSTETAQGTLCTPTKRPRDSGTAGLLFLPAAAAAPLSTLLLNPAVFLPSPSGSETEATPEKRPRTDAKEGSSEESRATPKQKNRRRCYRCQTKLELVQQELGSCRCGK